jgi:mannosylglycerate hydrolase MGH1-like protein
MNHEFESPYLQLLQNRIDLKTIPFSDRGSRLLVQRAGNQLSIRLAERWFKLDSQLSAYRDRPPLVDEWQFTDGNGQPLPFELTTHPHRISCQTPIGVFSVMFVDSETLLVALPAARCGVTFRAHLDRTQVDRRGGWLRLTGQIHRNLAYTVNAPILHNEVVAVGPGEQMIRLRMDASDGGRAILMNITPRLGFNRWVPEVGPTLEAAARRWHEWFAAVPPVADPFRSQYYYAWWIMRAGLLASRFYTTREAMTPSLIRYVGIWQWDNFFHALAYRHVEPRLAQNQIRILLDHQREDGMIPDAIHDEGIVTRLSFPVEADVTKPPLIAWAAWKLYEMDHDREFLDEIYEPLVRSNNWWFEKNDADSNGLCEYQHPFSSGLDDSPLWDDGMPVESPDLNSYLCLQQEALSKIAQVLGMPEEANLWARRAKNMAQRLIEVAWDDVAGLFWASHKGRRVEVRTPFNLFPLITGRMPRSIADRLVAHLTDEFEFWSRYPVPTVALNDPKFNPLQMWRGPTWVNINYLLIEGLHRSGYIDLAGELRHRTLELIASQADIYEYYHPQTGQNPPRAASVFGWSAAIYIDLAIQATYEAQRQTGEGP